MLVTFFGKYIFSKVASGDPMDLSLETAKNVRLNFRYIFAQNTKSKRELEGK